SATPSGTTRWLSCLEGPHGFTPLPATQLGTACLGLAPEFRTGRVAPFESPSKLGILTPLAPVAQLDRAPASGAGCGGSSPSGRTNLDAMRTVARKNWCSAGVPQMVLRRSTVEMPRGERQKSAMHTTRRADRWPAPQRRTHLRGDRSAQAFRYLRTKT